jgi:hypothetical protein
VLALCLLCIIGYGLATRETGVEYLAKPVTPTDLLSRIDQLLRS